MANSAENEISARRSILCVGSELIPSHFLVEKPLLGVADANGYKNVLH